jgi:hydroxymethylpyrimidine/phosphomethylpyrimidine kinase
MRTALTIAGSDSGGGAGIQADLKTFAAHGVYGTSAITAITAQNTLGVTAWQAIQSELVVAQIDAVVDDIGADAVKTGMLATADIVSAVSYAIAHHRLPHLVVDPVMIAKGGDRLLASAAVETLRADLLPLAQVVTPNIPEAEVLAEMEIASIDAMREAGRRILALGARVVLVKGGHLEGDRSIDIACAAGRIETFEAARIHTVHTHGTGCTLASAIAANLSLGREEMDAIGRAKRYVTEAIRRAPGIGRGHGPLGHFGPEIRAV